MAASDPTVAVPTPTGALQGVAAFSWDSTTWQPAGRAGPAVATPTGVLQGVAPFSWDGSAWQPVGKAQPGVATPTGVLDGVAVYTWSGSAWTPAGGTATPSTPTGALRGVAAFSWDGSAWQPAAQAGPSVATPYGVLQGVAMFNWSGSAWSPGSALPAGATLDLSFLNPGSLPPGVTFTRASTATYFDSTGTLQTATTNAPRWDYDPSTHALNGLLIEEPRTNLWLNSADASQWGKSNAVVAAPVVTANQSVAPDGTTTASRVVLPAVANVGESSFVYQGITTVAAIYAFSAYLKGAVGGEVVLMTNSVGGWIACTLTTQWQRFVLTGYTFTAGGSFLEIGSDRADASHPATPAQTFYVWGGQLEQGGFATSYIPTTAASVTRAVDVATMTAAGWFTSPGGSWMAEFISINPLVAASYRRIVTINAAAGVAPIVLENTASRLGQYDGANLFTAAAITVGAVAKSATTWVSGTGTACLNGGAIASGTLGSGYAGLTTSGVRFLSNATPAEGMSGYIRRVRYWPRILTNAELQSVTT